MITNVSIISSICFDLCAVMVILTLLFALIIRKLFRGRTNTIFIVLISVVLITGLLDIYKVVYDILAVNVTVLDTRLRYLVNYAYFFFRNLTAPIYILYICSYMGVWHKIKERGLLYACWFIPCLTDIVVLCINPFTPTIFSIDGNLGYHREPMIILIYIVAVFYIFMAIYILFHYRRLVPRSKALVLGFFLPLNGIALLIQGAFPSIRVEIFSSAVLTLAVAISVHRPEEVMDFVFDTHSHNAFLSDVKKNFSAKAPTCYLLINFTNHSVLRNSIGLDLYTSLIRRMADKMYQMVRIMKTHSDVYYLDNGTFALVSSSDSYEQLLDMGRILLAYTQEPVKLRQMEVMLDSKVCLVKCPDDLSNMNSFLNFTTSFQNRLPDAKRVVVLSDVSSSKDFRIRNDMDTIINRGILDNKFKMYYQPIYSLKKEKFVSAEALIRLFDDTYGMISPAIFIPAAEESGAIHQIGDFVLEDVCRFIASDEFKALELEYVEINLSVAQCIETNLFEKIDGFMKKYGVRPEQINLEITETSVDYDPETTDRNIKLLADAGLSFSLDDYGTGYSNIKRVVSLPLDIVKLDKSLVDDMDTPMMWTVIKNTVNMLKKMKKKILVEGVEEERSLLKFKELECDYIQGYYFSKPLSEEDFIAFIKRKNEKS